MKLISLCLLLLAVTFTWAKPPAADAVVVARLVEIPGKLPANDLYNYVYIFKYRVLQVVSGAVSEKEILVGQYNPRIPRPQVRDKMDPLVNGNAQGFQAGDIHRLSLVRPLDKVWKEAIEDEYFDNEAERWFAIQTDVEKK